MKVAAVIMAGGRGERFWPSSREDYPKQFLAFQGSETLLQQTVRRLDGLVSPADIWVVTREDYADLVYQQLPHVPQKQVLLEPQGRDTAPCIALAAMYIHAVDPDAVMLVLPADHMILQEERFRSVLRSGIALAGANQQLITLGIRPTRPETGYGYIQVGEPHGQAGEQEHPAFRVAAFREKPPRERAIAYLRQGGFYWNSGIFIWRAAAVREALAQHLPELAAGLAPLRAAIGTEREAAELRRIYPTLPKISIDYGVMERAANTLVIPADFGWDDLGTWAALDRVIPPDTNGNILAGRTVAVDTKNSVVQSLHNRLVVAFGVSDVVVVDTEDAVLVAHKERVTDLKAVVGRLEADGLRRHLRRPAVAGGADD